MLLTGHSYERSSIQRWLGQGHRTCPVTGALLPHYEMWPNHALRCAIQVRGLREGCERGGGSRGATACFPF